MKNQVVEIKISLELNEAESKLFDELAEVVGYDVMVSNILWLIQQDGIGENDMADIIREAFEIVE